MEDETCCNCGAGGDVSWWCTSCRSSMQPADKWYLIGFLNLSTGDILRRSNYLTQQENEDYISAYQMGCSDRLGA